MASTLTDTALVDAAEWIMAAATAALGEDAPDARWIALIPPAWDYCGLDPDDCSDGQLTVTLQRAVPSTTFPTPDTAPVGRCGTGVAASFVVEYVTCAPTPDDSGVVALETLQSAGEDLLNAGWAIYREIACQLVGEDPYPGIMVSVEPSGEMGGCHAVAVALTLHLL